MNLRNAVYKAVKEFVKERLEKGKSR